MEGEPEVIDLSPRGNLVAELHECRVECLASDKDVYLYYFLLRYPGRTIVFTSSIDGIRRLAPFLELLQFTVCPLHSGLQQKQRLKNLERFKSQTHAVLLSTDLAARGLDVQNVDHVVHYQLPRSADVYLHRNGRTARAQREGFALLMCSPSERGVYEAMFGKGKGGKGGILQRSSEVSTLAVDRILLNKLRQRVSLAKEIDDAQHSFKKQNHEAKWLKEMAEALDVELDDDNDGFNKYTDPRGRQLSSQKLMFMKDRLKSLLATPIVAPGTSLRYLTSGKDSDIYGSNKTFVQDLMEGTSHQGMLGVKKGDAKGDIVHRKSKRV